MSAVVKLKLVEFPHGCSSISDILQCEYFGCTFGQDTFFSLETADTQDKDKIENETQ